MSLIGKRIFFLRAQKTESLRERSGENNLMVETVFPTGTRKWQRTWHWMLWQCFTSSAVKPLYSMAIRPCRKQLQRRQSVARYQCGGHPSWNKCRTRNLSKRTNFILYIPDKSRAINRATLADVEQGMAINRATLADVEQGMLVLSTGKNETEFTA